jgi:hypothetical protein
MLSYLEEDLILWTLELYQQFPWDVKYSLTVLPTGGLEEIADVIYCRDKAQGHYWRVIHR